MLIAIVGEMTTGIDDMIEQFGKYAYLPPSQILINHECPEPDDSFLISEYMRSDDLYFCIINNKKFIDRIPQGVPTVLFTASLEDTMDAWRVMLNGLPLYYKFKIKREYGCFDNVKCDLHFIKGEKNAHAQAIEFLKLIHKHHTSAHKPYMREKPLD